MKAAVYYGPPSQELKIEELPKPKPDVGEVLIKVAAVGVCHTDLHYVYHGVPTFKKPPIILGHEISGVVEEVGPGAKSVKPNDKVLVNPMASCGRCYYCLTGRDNMCENGIMVGNHIDGGYAEYVKVPERAVVKMPDDLSIPLEEASVISDAVSTAYHAVKTRGGVRPGLKVAIFGAGGVGIHGVQVALALGAYVVVVDIDKRKLDLAKQLGAHAVVDAGAADPVNEIRKIVGKQGVDVAFDFVGNPQVTDQAFRATRQAGTTVVVGYSDKTWSVPLNRIMFREMAVLGSLGASLYEYDEIFELIKLGKLRPIVTGKYKLDQINEALRGLHEGKVVGRQIVTP